MPTKRPSPSPRSEVFRGKDLRVPNTTPEQLAKALMSGGAKPRPETRREKSK